MSETPLAPAPPSAQDELTAPQVLAELELLRRKSALIERRLATWEEGLVEVRKRLHILETERNPEAPEWQEELKDVQHRVRRLEERRLRAAPSPIAVSGPLAPPPGGPPRPEIEDAVAITRARWSVETAKAGDEVRLSAMTDGFAPGTALKLQVHSLAAGEPIALVDAQSDGDTLEARWKIPAGVTATELYFTVQHGGAQAKSSMLVVE